MFQPTKTDLDQQLDDIAYELRVAADDLEQAAERVRTGETLLDVAPSAAWLVERLWGRHGTVEPAPDRSARFTTPYVSLELLTTWVIGMDGQVVPIKPKAFELLAFLIRHPGQVFTRDQLLEHVWGYDYGGETRTVDVHVHWLRSRIESDPGHPSFIHTVRGVGYVFRRPV